MILLGLQKLKKIGFHTQFQTKDKVLGQILLSLFYLKS